MSDPASLPPDRFLILGHRGSPRRWPENSIASLRAALDEGADGFETDLRRLRDGSTVLFHDRDFRGAATEGFAERDLRAKLPGLAKVDEVIALVRSHACDPECPHLFDMEVKRRGWEADVVAAFAGMDNVVVSSFDHDLVEALARRETLDLGIVFAGPLTEAGKYVTDRGARWYFPEHRYVDRETVVGCHERGVKVVPWTANTLAAWKRVRETGCDGLMTDTPAEAVRWRAALWGHDRRRGRGPGRGGTGR
jgi:glycerophosphoryl diester phosphodiesterase